MDLVVATTNDNKVKEISEILRGTIWNVLGLSSFGKIEFPNEDAPTFLENARIKAKAAAKAIPGKWIIADDSGLQVDALNGEPGVNSARYATGKRDYAANNSKLLEKLSSVSADKRSAAFVCAMILLSPESEEWSVIEKCHGKIGFETRGNEGFGYDPLFIPNGFSKTFAELSADDKNAISHRGKALNRIRDLLKRLKRSDVC